MLLPLHYFRGNGKKGEENPLLNKDIHITPPTPSTASHNYIV